MPMPGPNAEGSDAGILAIIVAAVSVCINIVIAICGGIWTLGHSRNSTDEKISEKEKSDMASLIELERRLEGSIDKSVIMFGDTAAALRAKITDVELWNRDNFVSKKTFQAVTDELKRSWERFEDNLNDRFKDLGDKIDQQNKAD